MTQSVMNWDTLLNTHRLKDNPPKTEDGRTPFNSDHDKIIFSGAFRRLAKKTQVHPLATNDHVHNRLTHSLEVSCVGRTLGIRVGQKLNENNQLPASITPSDIGDIVEAICLAHDIGNPPFGHSGEEAIRAWFKKAGNHFIKNLAPQHKGDLENYEGNAQGFRILTTCEGYQYEYGMRLTYATLASFIKYPWTSLDSLTQKEFTKEGKFGIYSSENLIYHDVAMNTGLLKLDSSIYARHPLVYLMEAADDFCYTIIDLEDGISMGILSWADVYKIIELALDKKDIDEFEQHRATLSDGRKMSILRGLIIQKFVDAGAKAFIENQSDFLNGNIFRLKKDLISLCSPEVKAAVGEAKELAKSKLFKHPRKIELEIGAYNTLATLLENIIEAITEHIENKGNSKEISSKSNRVLDLLGRDTFSPEVKAYVNTENGDKNIATYHGIMRGLDFICGMTDHYANYLAQQFNGMGIFR
ncbi:deoxyguanosinetriphosphate triphosphohydrolase [Rheinheimera aquimaris]|uniref:Deoxyguanosinetriphosphate triphosphohydrolase n=1 Tax=Rheinheimera aquimaris TaxID=412437 RepID=A0ABP3NT01_9GAMM|nr:deoxyguanosinetriphosphate triphosphohydrolase [Rheinheimera aquimaris]MCB5213584.1 deoxyguanosinetriphosphate triphosphohydrolase [Rheinheimera aquimaris]